MQQGHLRPWAVGRLDVIFVSAGYVVIPNAVVNFISKFVQRGIVYLVVMAFMLFWGIEPRAADHFDWHTVRRRTKVKHLLHEQNVIRKFLPAGEVVLADAVEGKRLVQLHNSYVIVVNRLSPNLVGISQRTYHLQKILKKFTLKSDRLKVLNRYRVRYVYARSQSVRDKLGQRFGPSLHWLYKEKPLAVGVIH
jgi:hypothetical protein